MTLDESLVKEVDRMVARLGTTRSAFTREALGAALVRERERQLEARHRRGYEHYPLELDQPATWESEQVWGAG